MKKITILLADDHQLIRDSWKYILETDCRFAVVATASTGNEAIELSKSLRPDIVLMDVNMGEMNGFEATLQIRKGSPGSKIIGVSMHTMPAYVKKMLKSGASGYVTKNSSREELINAIIKVYEQTGISGPYTMPEYRKEIYRTQGGAPFLDGAYTVFGEVISGLDIVDAIGNSPTDITDKPVKDIRILKIKIIRK